MSEQTVADAKTGLQKLCLKHPSVSKGGRNSHFEVGNLHCSLNNAGPALQGSSAEIYLHGAHLTSFKPADGKVPVLITASETESDDSRWLPEHASMPQLLSVLQEVIFVSKQAVFAPPKAIRCADAWLCLQGTGSFWLNAVSTKL